MRRPHLLSSKPAKSSTAANFQSRAHRSGSVRCVEHEETDTGGAAPTTSAMRRGRQFSCCTARRRSLVIPAITHWGADAGCVSAAPPIDARAISVLGEQRGRKN